MRKLKLQIQMTVDGYIAGVNGGMDFMVWNWDDALNHYVKDITESIDCIVLGKNLAEGFIPYWAAVAANPDDPNSQQVRNLRTHPKLFSAQHLKSQNGTIPFWQKAILLTKFPG